MLTLFPNEIILQVVSYLDMYEKLNVIKTCHKMKAIASEKLFEDLTIPQHKTNIMIEQFGRRQYDGTRVKRLTFYIEKINPKVFSQLPTIFPNITELNQMSHPYDFPAIGSESQEQFKNWKDTLERYDMSENAIGIIPSLLLFSFSRLSFLELLPTYNTLVRQFTFSDVCRCVEHAPSLKTLVLRYFHIDMVSLEELHAKTSTLETLVIASGVINFNSSVFPRIIQPSVSIKTFRVGYSTDVYDKNCMLLKYVISKYPKIQNLYLLNTMSGSSTIDIGGSSSNTAYKEQMSTFLSYLVPRLKNLTVLYNI